MKTLVLAMVAAAALMASIAHAGDGQIVSTTGTRDNPIIVVEYDAADLEQGINDKQTIGRGRDFTYSITEDRVHVIFTNDHRTRGWHLCFALRALDAERRIIGDAVMKQGLREKGWRGRDRKVQTKPAAFPEETAYLQAQMWRCSEKDFLKEAIAHFEKLGKAVSAAKGVSGIFGVKLF